MAAPKVKLILSRLLIKHISSSVRVGIKPKRHQNMNSNVRRPSKLVLRGLAASRNLALPLFFLQPAPLWARL